MCNMILASLASLHLAFLSAGVPGVQYAFHAKVCRLMFFAPHTVALLLYCESNVSRCPSLRLEFHYAQCGREWVGYGECMLYIEEIMRWKDVHSLF